MSEIKKVLFAAGGTGGHVFPAIAVADAMKSVAPDVEIAFVGAAHGNESNWVQKAGYRFILLDLDFIKGASLGRKIKNILALLVKPEKYSTKKSPISSSDLAVTYRGRSSPWHPGETSKQPSWNRTPSRG